MLGVWLWCVGGDAPPGTKDDMSTLYRDLLWRRPRAVALENHMADMECEGSAMEITEQLVQKVLDVVVKRLVEIDFGCPGSQSLVHAVVKGISVAALWR